jgi:GTP-binding protein HflX
VLMTDTVGFIRKLPHQLVDSFASTLEEALSAELVLHVVDASMEEDELLEMIDAVDDVLAEIGVVENDSHLVLNKIDLVDADRLQELKFRHPGASLVSAVTGAGLDELLDTIAERLAAKLIRVELLLPYASGDVLDTLHQQAADLRREDRGDGVRVSAKVPAPLAARLKRFTATDSMSEAAPVSA